MLSLEHHVEISIRTFNRKLNKLNLHRKGFNVDSRTLVQNVSEMIKTDGENHGYRNIHQRLLLRGIQVQSKVVATALKIIDPEGCERRSRH